MLVTNESIGFNKAAPTMMLMDINSCFATIEQQANPLLRGKPVVVGAYTTSNGCILAASREAKKLGIKTGDRVGDAKARCPGLVVVSPDSDKYRFVNKKLQHLLSNYTDEAEVKSIDEMAFSLKDKPALIRRMQQGSTVEEGMMDIAREIKQKIRTEVGDWITVSIGIAPNRYLAKIGAGYHKPDGCTLITGANIHDILSSLGLTDLTGIKEGMRKRLATVGIYTSEAFYRATIRTLKYAFQSITGYHWWLRLHGWEADLPAAYLPPACLQGRARQGSQVIGEFSRKTIGHQHALRKALMPSDPELKHVLYQLIIKMGRRLREDHLTAQGIHVSCFYQDYTGWGRSEKQKDELYADHDFYEHSLRILCDAPERLIRVISVNCFDLKENLYTQESLFDQEHKKRQLSQALDAIAQRWGDFTVVPGRLAHIDQKVHDRIGFGNKHGIEFHMKGIV